MVRFWPFGGVSSPGGFWTEGYVQAWSKKAQANIVPKGDDNSPDSFERILSQLATRIESTSSKLATLRQRARRYKAMFTIYSVLGYILYCIVIVLVVGYQNIGVLKGAGLVVGPVVCVDSPSTFTGVLR